MEIQMKVEVWAKDGRCGQLSGVLLNSNNYHVSYILVSAGNKTREEHLVPLSLIAQASGSRITLSCLKDELELMSTIPADQILLRSEARVKAKDGYIGHIHMLRATPRTGNISAISVDKGGFLKRHQYITIPDTTLSRFEQNLVHVNMDKHDFSILTPVR